MIRLSFLLSFTFLFFGCVDSEEIFRKNFEALKNSDDLDEIISLLDEGSKEYFSELGKVAMKGKESEVDWFCNRTQVPFMSRYLIQFLGTVKQVDSTATFDLRTVIQYARLGEFGLLGFNSKQRYSFKELDHVEGNQALTIFRVSANATTNVTSRVQFNLEDEKWKINFPTSLSYAEKFLKKAWQKSGMAQREFVDDVLENGLSGVEFFIRY